MNLFRILSLHPRIFLRKAMRSAERTLFILSFAVAVPVLLVIAGLGIGHAGVRLGSPAMENAARWIIAVAAFLCSVYLLYFWIRVLFMTHGIVLFSKGAHAVKPGVSAIEREEAEKFIRWLAGITGWITLVCVFAMVFPLWRNVLVTLIVAVAMIGLSRAMTAQWFHGRMAQYAYLAAVLLVIVIGTLHLVSPKLTESIRGAGESGIDRVIGMLDRWSETRNSDGHEAAPETEPGKAAVAGSADEADLAPEIMKPGKKLSRPDLDEVFSELEKYPDL